MIAGQINLSRAQLFDRGGILTIQRQDNAAVAPHVSTVRMSTAVAANTNWQVMLFSLSIYRVTAAAPVGETYMSVVLWPSGGGALEVARLHMENIAVAGVADLIIPAQINMRAGDILQTFTADGGTGGTVDYRFAVTYLLGAA